MPFIANNEELRTFDPERNLELVTAGGGPGFSKFILRGPGFEHHFSGHTVSRRVEGVDPSLSRRRQQGSDLEDLPPPAHSGPVRGGDT